MNDLFNYGIYCGYIIKADLLGAIEYVKQFPSQIDLYNKYIAIFEHEQYLNYEIDTYLNGILTIYQRYYRDSFYLCIGKESAESRLRRRLADFLGISDANVGLCDMEQGQIAEVFTSKGYYFLGGRTGGYYGPYIWKTTKSKTYEVELPGGIQAYTVKLLDEFITKSWIDFLSFGAVGPGGWTDSDGIINCVESSYGFESENFKVSLLKHEAQHAMDLLLHKDMSSAELEYRAKLVELIYSRERNLLKQFVQEADCSEEGNGHTTASYRITTEFAKKCGKNFADSGALSIGEIQSIAKLLFNESNNKITSK